MRELGTVPSTLSSASGTKWSSRPEQELQGEPVPTRLLGAKEAEAEAACLGSWKLGDGRCRCLRIPWKCRLAASNLRSDEPWALSAKVARGSRDEATGGQGRLPGGDPGGAPGGAEVLGQVRRSRSTASRSRRAPRPRVQCLGDPWVAAHAHTARGAPSRCSSLFLSPSSLRMVLMCEIHMVKAPSRPVSGGVGDTPSSPGPSPGLISSCSSRAPSPANHASAFCVENLAPPRRTCHWKDRTFVLSCLAHFTPHMFSGLAHVVACVRIFFPF